MTAPVSSGSALVSIIVPVYNAAAHLEPCVRSILAQTHDHLELILIDDGSTDGSGEICDRLARDDARIVVRHQPNGGIASAQNAGLDLASGSLITFCDNDDLMSPRLLERLVGLLESTGADMSCCRWRNVGVSQGASELEKHREDLFGRHIVIDDPGTAYQTVFSLALRKLFGVELRYFSEANWGKLYRAELFDGIRFPAGQYAQDVAVAMDLYSRMSSVASCDDALYFWLQRGDSVSHRERSARYYSDIVRAHLRSFDEARAQGILPARAYTGIATLKYEGRSVRSEVDARRYAEDRASVRERLRALGLWRRALCLAIFWERMLEVKIYNLTVHRRR